MCISNVTKIKNIQNIQVMANQNKTDIGLIGLAVMGGRTLPEWSCKR